jgi:hypothetical protein
MRLARPHFNSPKGKQRDMPNKLAIAFALLAAPAFSQSFAGHTLELQVPHGETALTTTVPSGTTGVGGTITIVSGSAALVSACYATPIGGGGTGALAAINRVSGLWTGNLSIISAGSGYSSVPTSWQVTGSGPAHALNYACTGTITVTGGTLVSGAASVVGTGGSDWGSVLGAGLSASASQVTLFEGSADFTSYGTGNGNPPFIVADTTGGGITGVTVDASTSMPGFGAPQVSFDSSHIYLTLGGLSLSWGQQVTLDVTH